MSVELRAAWEWTCEECGEDNFCRSVTVLVAEDELVDYPPEIHDDLRQGAFYSMPASVKCQFCGAEYDINDPLEAE